MPTDTTTPPAQRQPQSNPRHQVPAEAFECFQGRWIAVRGAEIITDAATIEELDTNPLLPADTFIRGPDPTTTKFL